MSSVAQRLPLARLGEVKRHRPEYFLPHYWLAKRAWNQVGTAVRKGALPRAKTLKCVDCGKSAALYDHRDYSRPLEVEPVCNGCNQMRGTARYRFPSLKRRLA